MDIFGQKEIAGLKKQVKNLEERNSLLMDVILGASIKNPEIYLQASKILIDKGRRQVIDDIHNIYTDPDKVSLSDGIYHYLMADVKFRQEETKAEMRLKEIKNAVTTEGVESGGQAVN